jgi:hypothetical protein
MHSAFFCTLAGKQKRHPEAQNEGRTRCTPDRSDDRFDYASQEQTGHFICRETMRWRGETVCPAPRAPTTVSINGSGWTGWPLASLFLSFGQGW